MPDCHGHRRDAAHSGSVRSPLSPPPARPSSPTSLPSPVQCTFLMHVVVINARSLQRLHFCLWPLHRAVADYGLRIVKAQQQL